MKKLALTFLFTAGLITTNAFAAAKIESIGSSTISHLAAISWVHRDDADAFAKQYGCKEIKITKTHHHFRVSLDKCTSRPDSLSIVGVNSVTFDAKSKKEAEAFQKLHPRSQLKVAHHDLFRVTLATK